MKKAISYILVALAFSMTSFASPVNEHDKEGHDEKEFDVSEMIMHHVKDAHEWHL